ncbi:hypothetical protein [Oceanispirochaeta sp.]|jgi:hypothetical protein|uniref:hypothetical protein n=1 Tax=Oceanispirochaeta sp. TaxID=2035350 RepID=UPI0026264BE7|nr:hypothetical protein [Oceanispirochaeta sp.]MDA3957453.1 hypothetical protein [Oceanispirochaeta sp.]
MNQDISTIDLDERDFHSRETPGKGTLLSSDEIQLFLNMAGSIKNPKDRDFIEKLAKKEFITAQERKEMDSIFLNAMSRIKQESSFSA